LVTEEKEGMNNEPSGVNQQIMTERATGKYLYPKATVAMVSTDGEEEAKEEEEPELRGDAIAPQPI
jgi:hypothetical protein